MMKFKKTVIFFLYFLSFNTQTATRNALYELPLVISVCAYNNAPWVEKNLDSIFKQKYNNFHVIYIDDASSDETASIVQKYIDTHNLQDQITFFVNPTRCRKTKNIYNLFHTIPDEKIIVQVDGDDWLAHDEVFSIINQTYQNNDVWMTYGQFVNHPAGTIGNCVIIPQDIINNRSFRSWNWVYTHVRTFYAWLFKSIKLEDFMCELVPGHEGTFFPLGEDALSYFSMLEMCGNKFAFIPDILYVYNKANPLLTVKVEGHLRNSADKDIRNRSMYSQVKKSILHTLSAYENSQADLIMLSKDNPAGVRKLLNSLHKIIGIATIYVLFEQTDSIQKPYVSLQAAYPKVQFIPTVTTSVEKALHNVIQQSNQEYIVMAKDTAIVLQSFDISMCITELEKTQAYGFYFGFAHNKPPFYTPEANTPILPHEHIHDAIYAWKFKCAPYSLSNNFTMTLHKKNILIERAARLSKNNSIDTFIDAWQTVRHANSHNIGLFFDKEFIGRTSIK